MHRFERCQSTESMIGDQGGSRKSRRVEQFWEQKVQKGQDVFFTTCITLSPASGRQFNSFQRRKDCQNFETEFLFSKTDTPPLELPAACVTVQTIPPDKLFAGFPSRLLITHRLIIIYTRIGQNVCEGLR